jgi:hypothetical protein
MAQSVVIHQNLYWGIIEKQTKMSVKIIGFRTGFELGTYRMVSRRLTDSTVAFCDNFVSRLITLYEI